MTELTHEEECVATVLRDRGVCSDTIVVVIKALREEAVFDTERAVRQFMFSQGA